MRGDLSEIVERVKSACARSRIAILTNGILTDVIIKQMEEIVKIEPEIAIRLSIDGIGEVNDSMRGIKNAYINAIKTLGALKKLRIQDLGLTITVTDFNITEIEKVYRIAREANVKFNCQVAHSSDFYYKKKNNEISRKDLFKEGLNTLISSELKSFNLARLFKAYYYRGLWNYINRLPRAYFCGAGSLFFYLSQEGSVYPCLFLDKQMGNLKNDDFDTIWKSELASQARQSVQKCNLSCWTICTAAPAIRNNPLPAAGWVFMNKLKAHLGSRNLL